MNRVLRTRQRMFALALPLTAALYITAEGLDPKGSDQIVTTTAVAFKVLPIAAKHHTQLYLSGSLSELALGALIISYLHRSEPVFVFHQGAAVGDDGVDDGVPVTTELDSDLVPGPGVTADLFGDPRQAGGTAERGKIDKGDHRTVLHPGEHAQLRASRTSSTSFDMEGQRGAHLVFEAEHGHVRQADKLLAHARRVCHHRGSSSAIVEKPQTGGSPPRARGSLPSGHTPLASEVPLE